MNGTLVRGYLWSGSRLVAEVDAAGVVLARFVYGTRGHVPDYVVRGGLTYRLVTDERGSVRLVVNTTTGAVAQRLGYDAWGRVSADTNPGSSRSGSPAASPTPTPDSSASAPRLDPLSTQWLSTGPRAHAAIPRGVRLPRGSSPMPTR